MERIVSYNELLDKAEKYKKYYYDLLHVCSMIFFDSIYSDL